MGVACCHTRSKDAPFEDYTANTLTSFEAVNSEEAYMVQKQIDLGLHNRKINDFLIYIDPKGPKLITQADFLNILLKLRLVDHKENIDSVFWQRFYSKFKSPLASGAAPNSAN